MKVSWYNWHSAGSPGWPFPVLKYKHIFQINYTEADTLNRTQKLLWFEITEMLTSVKKNKFIVLCIIIFVPHCLKTNQRIMIDEESRGMKKTAHREE